MWTPHPLYKPRFGSIQAFQKIDEAQKIFNTSKNPKFLITGTPNPNSYNVDDEIVVLLRDDSQGHHASFWQDFVQHLYLGNAGIQLTEQMIFKAIGKLSTLSGELFTLPEDWKTQIEELKQKPSDLNARKHLYNLVIEALTGIKAIRRYLQPPSQESPPLNAFYQPTKSWF